MSILRERTVIQRGVVLGAILICLLALSSTSQGGEIFPRDQILFPFAPAAMADGPGALRLNPAAVGTDPEFALTYYHSYSDSSFKGDNALYTAFRGLGFSIEWLGSGAAVDGKAYTIGFGTSGQKSFSVGSAYQWRSSDDPVQNKSHFWSHGFLWRPNNVLSLAGVVQNYNRMRVPTGKSDAEFVYSAAVRLLKGRWLIGGDWYQTTSQRLKDGTYRLATSFEAKEGLTLYGDFDENESYNLGIKLNMTSWFVGSHSSFDSEKSYRGGVLYAGIHKTRRKPVVNWFREVAMIDIAGDIPDRRPARSIFGPAVPTTFDYLAALENARIDPEIRAVVMRINNPNLGWARREELRRAIARVRTAGKPTIAYLDGMVSNGEYYLASAADRIVAPPVSTVDVIGLRSEVTFAKRLLDKIGVVADLEHIGDYKNASDLLTRTEMSPEHREAVTTLLDDLDRQWVGELATGREVTSEKVRSWIDHGPYASVEAHQAGLIDTIAYPDEIDGIVREMSGPFWRSVNLTDLLERVYERDGWAEPARVAVVFAEGGIQDGVDRSEVFGGQVMGSATISRAIRKAREDYLVRALVLRVNSGGGSVFGSDEIWREVARTVGRKPIIVSFGDVAASGGYYIACAADSIFAMPNTITGSIGIITGKLDLSGLYDKIGLDKEVITRGRYADLYGTDGQFNDEERAVIRAQMTRAYDHFVELVADGRHLSADSVDAIGQGRVWSGEAARERGLVDRFADLHECITVAARMAGIKSGEDVDVVVLPDQRWQLFDLGPLNLAGALASGDAFGGLVETVLDKTGIHSADGEPVFELPYRVTIR
jgi:protease-4